MKHNFHLLWNSSTIFLMTWSKFLFLMPNPYIGTSWTSKMISIYKHLIVTLSVKLGLLRRMMILYIKSITCYYLEMMKFSFVGLFVFCHPWISAENVFSFLKESLFIWSWTTWTATYTLDLVINIVCKHKAFNFWSKRCSQIILRAAL